MSSHSTSNKQTEVIHPPPPATPELGNLRGEPVEPHSSVVSLEAGKNWMKSEGRTVGERNQALKVVKVRARTVEKISGAEGVVGGELLSQKQSYVTTNQQKPNLTFSLP